MTIEMDKSASGEFVVDTTEVVETNARASRPLEIEAVAIPVAPRCLSVQIDMREAEMEMDELAAQVIANDEEIRKFSRPVRIIDKFAAFVR